MDPSRSRRLIRVINNCEGPRTIQYKYICIVLSGVITIVTFLCFHLSFIKFLINTREQQKLPGVDLVRSSIS